MSRSFSSQSLSPCQLFPSLTRPSFLVLLSILLLSLLSFSSSVVVTGGKVPISILSNRGFTASQLMEAAEVAYSIERPDLELSGALVTVPEMVTNLYGQPQTIDYFVTGQKPGDVYRAELTQLIQSSGSDIISFPLAASAIVPLYNLPGQTIPLLLSRHVLTSIMSGDITRWDDPQLQALNPAMTLPSMNITMVLPGDATTQALAFSQALAKFDPTWVARFGSPSDEVAWPRAKYAAWVNVIGALTSYVIATPYTFSFGLISNAVPLSAQYASMINKAGQVVQCDTASINYAFLELGATPNPTTGKIEWNQDMSDGSGYESWPMTFSLAVYLPVSKARTTCLARAEVVNFFLWFLASPVVRNIATSLSISILPDLVYSNLDLSTLLRDTIRCEGATVSANEVNKIQLAGISTTTIYSDLLTSYLGFFGSTDPGYTYSFTTQTELQSIQQLSARELDMAYILPQQFSRMHAGIIEPYAYNVELAEAGQASQTGDLLVLPWSMYAVTIVHSLPLSIASTWSSWPLRVTMSVLGRIFVGDIKQWNDPALDELNPGLAAAFAAQPSTNPNITFVTCCKASTTTATTPSPVTNALQLALSVASQTFDTKSQWSLPSQWTMLLKTLNAAGHPSLQVNIEQQLESAVLRTSGAIGYKLSYSPTLDVQHEFAIVRETEVGKLRADTGATPTTTARRTVLTPTIASMKSCALAAEAQGQTLDYKYDPSFIVPTESNFDLVSQCYPLTFLTSFVMPGTYTGSQCKRGNRTLSLAAWMMADDSLTSSSEYRGMFRLSEIPSVADAQIRALNSVECDGETMQIIKPHVWELDSTITFVGWALCSIGLFVVLVSAIILWVYRQRSVLRSSSVPFQFVVLVGISIMYMSMGIIASAPTTANCQSLAWLLNIGFTLMFGPLFAKMWRIYRIYGTRRLTVVKISNEALALIPIFMVIKDVILNVVWQLTSPVYVGAIYIVENGRTTTYAQCTGDSGALPFLLIIMVLKFLLLVFGSFMGFTTRNVASTFNESKNVAWAIYSVFFAVAIIVPILIFSSAHGDSFTILLVFLLFWIPTTTLLLNFGSKFLVLFRSGDDNGNGNGVDANKSSRGDGLGEEMSSLFSFPTLAVLPKGALDRYISALEQQMVAAKQRHRILLGGGGGTGGGAGAGPSTGAHERRPTYTQMNPNASHSDRERVTGTGGTGPLTKQVSRSGINVNHNNHRDRDINGSIQLTNLNTAPTASNSTIGTGGGQPHGGWATVTSADSYRVIDPSDDGVASGSSHPSPVGSVAIGGGGGHSSPTPMRLGLSAAARAASPSATNESPVIIHRSSAQPAKPSSRAAPALQAAAAAAAAALNHANGGTATNNGETDTSPTNANLLADSTDALVDAETPLITLPGGTGNDVAAPASDESIIVGSTSPNSTSVNGAPEVSSPVAAPVVPSDSDVVVGDGSWTEPSPTAPKKEDEVKLL